MNVFNGCLTFKNEKLKLNSRLRTILDLNKSWTILSIEELKYEVL